MSVQENNQIIEKWFATINGKDYGGYLDLFSDDIVARSTANTEPMEGKEVFRQQLQGLHAAFPDYYLEIKNSVVEDDQFVCEIEAYRGAQPGTRHGPDPCNWKEISH